MAIASPVLRVLMKQISDNVKFEYIWYKIPYVFFIVYFKGEMLNAIEPKNTKVMNQMKKNTGLYRKDKLSKLSF